MTSPILLVGEANPYSPDPKYALYDLPIRASGSRLRRLVLGLSRRTYLGPTFLRFDLCASKWNLAQAREQAAELAQAHCTTVLLGRKVAMAFGFKSPPFSIIDQRFILLPHPSGLCRDWSLPDAFDRARDLLRSVRPDVPWGEE